MAGIEILRIMRKNGNISRRSELVYEWMPHGTDNSTKETASDQILRSASPSKIQEKRSGISWFKSV